MVTHLLDARSRVVNDVHGTSIPCPALVRTGAIAYADNRPTGRE